MSYVHQPAPQSPASAPRQAPSDIDPQTSRAGFRLPESLWRGVLPRGNGWR